MARIPTYDEKVRQRPVNQQKLRVNATGEAFGAGIGRAVSGLGSSLMDVADAVAAKQAVKAEADATDALNRYIDQQRQILSNPDTGALNQTGGAAMDQFQPVTERLRQIEADIVGGLSPAAQRVFRERVAPIQHDAKDDLINHESKNTRTYLNEQAQAEVDNYTDLALDHYADPDKRDRYLQLAIGAAVDNAKLNGMSPEAQQKLKDDLVDQNTFNLAVRIATDDPLAAEAFIEEYKGRLSAENYTKLTQDLETAVVEAKARRQVDDWVRGIGINMEVDEHGSVVDQYGRPTWLVQAESGGDPQARATTSSATGPVQFTEGTYLDFVQRVRAKGGAAWAEGLSREEILATRTDEAKSGEIYREFRSYNQGVLREIGAPITPRNEYIMHHFGAGTGSDMIAFEQQGMRGMSMKDFFRSIGDMAAYEANPYLQGMTLGKLLNTLEAKSSRGVSSVSAAMEKALQIEDPKVRAAAIEQISRRQQIIQAQRADERQQAADEAWDYLNEGGDPEKLPTQLQMQLGAEGYASFLSTARNLETGPDTTDEMRYQELKDLAVSDPMQFLEAFDLNDDRGNLSRQAYDEMRTMRRQILSNRVKDPELAGGVYKASDLKTARTDAQDLYYAATGVDPSKIDDEEEMGRWNNFTREMERAMVRYAEENGVAMDPMTWRATVSKLLTPTVFRNPAPDAPKGGNPFFQMGAQARARSGEEGFLFEAPQRGDDQTYELETDYESIERADRARISQNLANLYGREPTTGEVEEHYELELLASMGIMPDMSIEDLPEEVVERVRREVPDASDEEVLDLYIQFLAEVTNGG